SYPTIGLESCFLKLVCLLIHKCLYVWATEKGVIPDSQNGEHYRTYNSVFWIGSSLARAEGRTLRIAFLDITNAFSSTNHDLLWTKLYKTGVTGKLFD
ncbi:hypothetical protein C8R44DRAFT_569417, partial [Mycena epipterygia]